MLDLNKSLPIECPKMNRIKHEISQVGNFVHADRSLAALDSRKLQNDLSGSELILYCYVVYIERR